jgi:hypothetical protein
MTLEDGERRRAGQTKTNRPEVDQILQEFLTWSNGKGENGPYCKLCGGEGVDVEHEEHCPVPDVRPALNARRPDVTVLIGLVQCFVIRADEDSEDGIVCKLCGSVWVLHRTGCPVVRAWRLLQLKPVFRCLKCGTTEEQPHWGLDKAEGLCKLCSLDKDLEERTGWH